MVVMVATAHRPFILPLLYSDMARRTQPLRSICWGSFNLTQGLIQVSPIFLEPIISISGTFHAYHLWGDLVAVKLQKSNNNFPRQWHEFAVSPKKSCPSPLIHSTSCSQLCVSPKQRQTPKREFVTTQAIIHTLLLSPNLPNWEL